MVDQEKLFREWRKNNFLSREQALDAFRKEIGILNWSNRYESFADKMWQAAYDASREGFMAGFIAGLQSKDDK